MRYFDVPSSRFFGLGRAPREGNASRRIPIRGFFSLIWQFPTGQFPAGDVFGAAHSPRAAPAPFPLPSRTVCGTPRSQCDIAIPIFPDFRSVVFEAQSATHCGRYCTNCRIARFKSYRGPPLNRDFAISQITTPHATVIPGFRKL